MAAYRKWLDSLPLIVKIILALPGLDGISTAFIVFAREI